jgi:molybdopterin-guanine dinucleotide biosynthesis protein A
MVAVVACDMPFASATLLRAASRILVEEDVDVVIPGAAPRAERAGKSVEGYEPLHAVYRRETCLPAIEAAIDADQWKVIAWFPQVKVRVLTPKEIKEYDPAGLAFWNVNTPEEFSKAETLAQAST